MIQEYVLLLVKEEVMVEIGVKMVQARQQIMRCINLNLQMVVKQEKLYVDLISL